MKPKILVVAANYYKNISFNLNLHTSGFLDKKTKYTFISVPGVFEIPVVISKNIKKYDGFIALKAKPHILILFHLQLQMQL